MNKILSMTLVLGGALFLGSCVNEEEDLFDKSAAERLNEASALYTSRLQAHEAGWAMQYYPTYDSEAPYGNGYLILTQFNKDGSCKIAADCPEIIPMKDDDGKITGYMSLTNGYVEDVSLWRVITDDGPVLTYDSYNKAFHYFADPSSSATGYGDTGVGVGGDYEFVIVDAPEDGSYLMLKGKKRGTYNLLTPLEDGTDFQNYLEDVNNFQKLVFSTSAPNRNYMYMKGSDKMYFDDAWTTIPVIYGIGADKVSQSQTQHFVINKRGEDYYLRFRDAWEDADGNVIQDFRYDRELDRFVCVTTDETYIEGERETGKFFYETAIGATHRWTWKADTDKSESVAALYTAVADGFKALKNNKGKSYSLNQMSLRTLQNGKFVMHIDGKNASGGNLKDYDYLFNIEQDSPDKVRLSFIEPDGATATTSLTAIPAIKDFIDFLSQEFVIEGGETAFNLSKVRLISAANADDWLIMMFN